MATSPGGRPVRYGLANDSKKINTLLKSADLIGITPVLVTEDMIGETLGVFTSIEVKKKGFRKDARFQAQKRWQELVRKHGGIAEIIEG